MDQKADAEIVANVLKGDVQSYALGIGDTLKNLSYFEVIETAMYVLVFMERTSLFECLVCSCSAFHSL